MRHPAALLLAVLVCLPLVAQEAPADLGLRLREAVGAYQKLVEELDLNSVPGDVPDYPLVTDNLERLGRRLEPLSRRAGQLDALTPEQRESLARELDLFLADLQQLRCQSVPLRAWSFWNDHGFKKPHWGLAFSRSAEPLARPLRQFDAEVDNEIELTAKPGETVSLQVIAVPLSRDLKGLKGSVNIFRAKSGALPGQAVSLRAVQYDNVQDDTPDVPADLSQAFLLTIAVPDTQSPGDYRGKITLSPKNSRPLELKLTITVQPGE